MKKNILLLTASFLFGASFTSTGFAAQPAKAKEPKASVTATVSAVSVKQQFDDACKQYEQLKADLQKQAFDVIVLKERLDKATQVVEIYRESLDYMSAKQEGAWAEQNYNEATSSYQKGTKDLEEMKSKLAVAEISLEKVLVQYNLSMGKN
ncbi:MAG: hypothetical protein HGB11_06140 [Chlorobiales bacterium]|nr:hypothetical protein [Chlorobiales bacterium]